MKIYLDTCCYGRPWDNQNDPLIAADTIAVMTVIEAVRLSGRRVVGSTAVTFELGNIPLDNPYRPDILDFYDDTIDDNFMLSAAEFARARDLQASGVGAMDSLHLAAAETAGAAYLLTTDVGFWKKVQKKNLSAVKVLDPLTFLAGGIV